MRDFNKQYEHPLWQKKRLEKLESAGWQCEICLSKDKQIHVHHKFYRKLAKVWEYEVSDLAALCDECHKKTHDQWNSVNELIVEMKSWSISPECLIGYLKATVEDRKNEIYETSDPTHTIDLNLFSLEGVAQYFGIPSSLVCAHRTNEIRKLKSLRDSLERFFLQVSP